MSAWNQHCKVQQPEMRSFARTRQSCPVPSRAMGWRQCDVRVWGEQMATHSRAGLLCQKKAGPAWWPEPLPGWQPALTTTGHRRLVLEFHGTRNFTRQPSGAWEGELGNTQSKAPDFSCGTWISVPARPCSSVRDATLPIL